MFNELCYGEKIDIDDVNDFISEFVEIYEGRPVRDNRGGMMSVHLFWTWYMCRKLRPQIIIESGVFKGQGTWMMRKACPDASLFCIDPDLSQRVYIDKEAKYFSQDFNLINWNKLIEQENLENALCFFDDHQNAYYRLQEMKWMGFKKAMFEDNYPITRGDCYSMIKVMSKTGFNEDVKNSGDVIPPNDAHEAYIKNNLLTYMTFPPLEKSECTRWGDAWTDDMYPTDAPVLSNENKKKYPVFADEADAYNWICYVQLR